jgi:ADP-ribose pyrophosphatase
MIKQLTTKLVYESKWMKLRVDDIEYEGGTKGVYDVVDKPDFALIVPLVDDKLYLVKQYRYPVEGVFWEFPQGSHEEDPGIDARKLALSELKEETGLTAKKIKKIGYLHEAYGFCSQGFHIFLAEDFTQGEQQLEAGEEGMEVGLFSIAEFEKMVKDGKIRDAATVSAYGLLKMSNVA